MNVANVTFSYEFACHLTTCTQLVITNLKHQTKAGNAKLKKKKKKKKKQDEISLLLHLVARFKIQFICLLVFILIITNVSMYGEVTSRNHKAYS